MSSTLETSVFMGKNYSDNSHSIKNTGQDVTMKQMFDMPEKLITEQSDEIHGVNTINWGDSAWTHLSLIQSLARKGYVFSDSVLPGCVNIGAGGKKVCGGFRNWYAYG